MPKKEWTEEERKAFAEKMKKARQKAKKEEKEDEVTITQSDFQSLLKQIEELKQAQNSNTYVPQGPTVTAQGVVGTVEKYSTRKEIYADPRERLAAEGRLKRFAFSENYELDWEVQTTRYQTIDGTWVKEPKFILTLSRIVFDEDSGEPTNKRYKIATLIHHEDPDSAITVAEQNGLEVPENVQIDFLNEMRYLVMRDWLFGKFYHQPADRRSERKEEVINGKLVEFYEINSTNSETMPFDKMKTKLQMQYKPFPTQREAHKAFLVDNYKRGVLYWSRRTGKTRWSVQQLVFSAILNQGPHHIVFKEYQQAETVAWNQYLHTIPKAMIAPKGLNKSNLTITFRHFHGKVKLPGGQEIEVNHDESKPPSTIRLLGSDKADSHRGGESMGMIFDEYQDQDPYWWETVYKPFFATTDGWACFMGTAKDIDHWNELLEKAEMDDRWFYSKATWRKNPLIKPEWVEAERKEAEIDGTLGQFEQEMELIPYSLQGAVYPDFQTKTHVISQEDVPKEGEDYIGLDFGFAEGHPMAAVFVRIDAKTDTWYQYDEIHGTGIQIDDEFLSLLRAKAGDRHIKGIIADSARPDLIEYLQSKGLPVIPAPKKQNSVLSGIQLFSKRLKPKQQIIGAPKPNYFVTKNCKATRHDFKRYRYKEVKANRHPQENPEKRNDDTMDALRYIELFFKFGLADDYNMPVQSTTKQLNEFGLL